MTAFQRCFYFGGTVLLSSCWCVFLWSRLSEVFPGNSGLSLDLPVPLSLSITAFWSPVLHSLDTVGITPDATQPLQLSTHEARPRRSTASTGGGQGKIRSIAVFTGKRTLAFWKGSWLKNEAPAEGKTPSALLFSYMPCVNFRVCHPPAPFSFISIASLASTSTPNSVFATGRITWQKRMK